MTIRFYCADCGQEYHVEVQSAGRKAKCNRCGGITEIPASDPATEERPHHEPADMDYRCPGELVALVVSVAITAVVAFGLFAINPLVAASLVGVAFVYVRIHQGTILGNSARVGPDSFLDLHRRIQRACSRLDTPSPKTYVKQDPTINAFAIGFRHPFSVVLHSATVQAMDDRELLFICGHELGHIKHRHTVWLTVIAPFGRDIPGSNLLFGIWKRKGEYTADRSGLIACRDLKAAVGAMIKMSAGAGALEHTNVDEFLRQAAEIDGSAADKVGEYLGTHPYITNRIRRLIRFSESPIYRGLVDGRR